MPSCLRSLAGALALAVLLPGCGGAEQKDASADRSSFSVEITEPADLVPGNVTETGGGTVVRQLFRGLTSFDPETGEAVNEVARSITSPDRRKWTVELESGWTFHNGEPVTAESFAGAWNAVLSEAWGSSYFFTDLLQIKGARDLPKGGRISGLTVVDDDTLTISLDEPNTNLPLILAYSAFYPMPESVLRSRDWAAYKERPVGNGPFELAGPWQHGEQIVVQRYAGYAGADRPRAERVTLRIYGSATAAYDDAVTGKLDVASVPAERLSRARKDFGSRYVQAESSVVTYLTFPLWREEFADVRMRQALSTAVDRAALADDALGGTVLPAKGLVSPLVKMGHRDDPCGRGCDHDPAEARRSYEAAGGLPGDRLTLWLRQGSGNEVAVEAVADQLRDTLALEVSVESLPMAQYDKAIRDRDATGPFLEGWSMDYPSMENYLGPTYGTGGPANTSGYRNSAVDELLARGNAAAAPDEATVSYQRAEDLVLRDLPSMPLWFEQSQTVHSARIAHLTRDSLGFLRLDQVDITQ